MPENIQGVDVKYDKKEALGALKKQYTYLTDEISSLKEQYESAKKLLKEKLIELNPLLEQVASLEKEKESLLNGNIEIKRENEQTIKSMLGEIEVLDDKIKKRNEEIGKELDDLEEVRKTLAKEKNNFELDKIKLKRSVDELASQEESLKKEIELKSKILSVKDAEVSEKLEGLEKNENSLKANQERYMWQKNDMDKREVELERLIKEWKEKEKELIQAVEAERLKHLEYKGKMKHHEDSLNGLRINLAKKEKHLRDKENGLKAVKGKLIEQQAKLKEYIHTKKVGFDWRELEI